VRTETEKKQNTPIKEEEGTCLREDITRVVVVINYCTLLTVDDDMGCSFMLVASDMGRNLDCTSAHIRVQTVSSSRWRPMEPRQDHQRPPMPLAVQEPGQDRTGQDRDNDATVVVSVIVNWLMHVCGACLDDVGEYILASDMNAATVGLVHIPKDCQRASTTRRSRSPPSRLASSLDGKLSFGDQRSGVVFLLFHGNSVLLDIHEDGGKERRASGTKWNASWLHPKFRLQIPFIFLIYFCLLAASIHSSVSSSVQSVFFFCKSYLFSFFALVFFLVRPFIRFFFTK
jgi:hypothetical protein